ncbi:MAG: rhodanese-like domain-containing protein [Thermoanaerobaculia bacterium]
MSGRRIHLALALTALAGGLGAALAGLPDAASASASISALDLARAIRARQPGLAIVDLRPAAAFARGHVPSSENRPDGRASEMNPGTAAMIVLVSTDRTPAAHRSTERLLPHLAQNVLWLRGGYDAWLTDVLNPERALDVPPSEIAAFAEISELSRYFGGVPRIVDRPRAGGSEEAAVALASRTRRRGC